jgi:hypothetical protein
MSRVSLALLALILSPVSAYAAHTPASFSAGQSLLLASSTPGNVYATGASVVVAAPVGGDLSAFGGSIIAASPIVGDALLFAGSIRSRARVGGDVRAFGGSVSIEEPVAGDLFAFGATVHDSGRASGSVFIVAGNTTLTNGATGPVTIYGNNISLGGDFGGDVTVIASGRVSLSASTTIAGALSYQSPEEALIPASATIVGGVTYTNASYLPDVGTSRILSLISIGFFLFVRVLGALILAGLLAGLFPRFAETFVGRVAVMRPSRILLAALLGFAVFVVTPILTLLLALTFVGIGLALLLFILYLLTILLALLYAGILIGSLLARRFARRDAVLWRDGVLGMLILSLVTLIPYIGLFAVFFATALSAGTLVLIFFHFAFSHPEETAELL